MAKRRNNNNESPAATKKHRANDDVQEREEVRTIDVFYKIAPIAD